MQTIFFLSFMLFEIKVSGQTWKTYLDTAYKYNIANNPKKANYYGHKSKNVLPADSLGTIAESLICEIIGQTYHFIGRTNNAIPYMIREKTIEKKYLGDSAKKYWGTINILGSYFKETGQFNKAEKEYNEVLDLIKSYKGRYNFYYSAVISALGELNMNTGEYDKAERYLLEGELVNKEIANSSGSSLILADFYSNIGQYNKAEAYYLKSYNMVRLSDTTKEDNYESYGANCSSLGNFYLETKQYQKAEAFLLEAKLVSEKINGKEHPNYAAMLANLGNLYSEINQYSKAEAFYKEAKKILSKSKNDDGITCANLGNLYLTSGKLDEAVPLLVEAKSEIKNFYGDQSSVYISTCISLGNLYWNKKLPIKANEYYLIALKSQQKDIDKIFNFTNETEKQFYLKKILDLNNYFFSINISNYSKLTQNITYNVSLFNRNLILSSSEQVRKSIFNNADTSLQNKYKVWIDARQQLAFWNSRIVADKPAYIKDLEEQANTLEKDLTRLCSNFKNQPAQNNVTWKGIQQNLKTHEAAIEFVNFNFYNGKRYTDSTYYIALLLRKDKPQPELIKLFEKKQLDSILLNKGNDENENITNLYAYTDNNSSRKSIYDLVWKPIEKSLKGITKIYFAPSGKLHTIAFAGLPVGNNKVLSDKYQLIELNTTASVTNQVPSFINTTDNINLYGGIKYDTDSIELKLTAKLSTSSKDNIASRSVPDDLERGGSFNYLPGTEAEVESIKSESEKIKNHVNILSGVNATEESFKALNGKASPAIIHIATHGFFFPDPKEEKDKIFTKFETSGKVFKQSDNPLFRSGLLFAGANYAWKGKPIEGIEDGILTSYEVSNMYLPNTKLVVLSACETALGDIQGSEGVYGLQRAFKIAGVQNLVMSLWKVPDAETSEFMQLFYKNLFAKESISDAFYNAQTIMKNKYRTEPYKWAAWILVR